MTTKQGVSMVLLGLAALALTGCVTPQQQRDTFVADAKTRCLQIGHRAGSAQFKRCTERLYTARTQEQALADDASRRNLRRMDYCMSRSMGFGIGFGPRAYDPFWGPRPYGFVVDDWC